MMRTEFIRHLNCNYERLILSEPPDENRYQYCIITRGGIKGILPCSLRNIDEISYLYFDITSTQNIMQLYIGKKLDRIWLKNFLWSMRQIKLELDRFLLNADNLIWQPKHIFQDLASNNFNFLYIPYYKEDTDFLPLIEYWVDHIDYDDNGLVEFVYKSHEQFEHYGSDYLQKQIFEDAKIMDDEYVGSSICLENNSQIAGEADDGNNPQNKSRKSPEESLYDLKATAREEINEELKSRNLQNNVEPEVKTTKKGIRFYLEGRKKKEKEDRDYLRMETRKMLDDIIDPKEPFYQEDYGKTIYLEDVPGEENVIHKLYPSAGGGVVEITKAAIVIGKKKEEADYVITDNSVSRIHARILAEENDIYIEDLNSTNGTFKNGLRMQPYEKKKLEMEDEIKLGKVVFVYR